MKHLMLCLLALGFSAVFTACDKDDDGNGPAFSKDGKRLVKKITMTYGNYPDELDELTFSYDADGRITVTEYTLAYISEEKKKKCTDINRYTYSVSGKTLKVVHTYTDGDDGKYSGTYGGTFTLNDDGLVISGEETDSDDDKFVYTNTYSDDLYLTQIEYTRNGGPKQYINYTRSNGDITKGIYDENYTYCDEENKANIDFAGIDSFMLGYDRSNLGITGYLGKQNKHLLKTVDGETYTYKFDKEGYVTEFTVTSEDGPLNYRISYN